jgi:hypothetical protein
VDPKAGLDDVEKRTFLTLAGFELRPLGRPTRSQSLSQLCYPGSVLCVSIRLKCTSQIIILCYFGIRVEVL